MFNVTVLKMKDLVKYFTGIIITLLIIMLISNNLKKETKEEKIVREVKTGINLLFENILTQSLDKIIPTMAIMKENEYELKENEKFEEQDLLKLVLGTQISSIKGLEIAEEIDDIVKSSGISENEENQIEETMEISLARSRNENRDNNTKSFKR